MNNKINLNKKVTLLDLYPDKIGQLIVAGLTNCPVPLEDMLNNTKKV